MIEKLVSYINSIQNFLIKIDYVIENIYFQDPGVCITINSLNYRNNRIYFVVLYETMGKVEIYDTTYQIFGPSREKTLSDYIKEKEPDASIESSYFTKDVFTSTVLKLLGVYDDKFNLLYDFVNEVVDICRNQLTLNPVIFGTDILIEEFCIKLSVNIHRDRDVRGDNKFIGTVYIPTVTVNDMTKLELRLWEQEKWERTGLIMDFVLKLITSDLDND